MLKQPVRLLSTASAADIPPLMLGIAEFARLLDVSIPTIRRWSKNGKLPPPVKLSSTVIRWRRVDIDAFVAGLSCGQKAEES